jgi:hypothetical protein
MTLELELAAGALQELASSRQYDPSVSTAVGDTALNWAFTPTKGYSMHYSFTLAGSRALADVCEGGACSFTLSSSSICVAGSLQQQEEVVVPASLPGASKQTQAQAVLNAKGRRTLGRNMQGR